jgi:hypothetical protein
MPSWEVTSAQWPSTAYVHTLPHASTIVSCTNARVLVSHHISVKIGWSGTIIFLFSYFGAGRRICGSSPDFCPCLAILPCLSHSHNLPSLAPPLQDAPQSSWFPPCLRILNVAHHAFSPNAVTCLDLQAVSQSS